MFTEEHTDHNSEEPRDFRHADDDDDIVNRDPEDGKKCNLPAASLTGRL
jgi:hypothetical protein